MLDIIIQSENSLTRFLAALYLKAIVKPHEGPARRDELGFGFFVGTDTKERVIIFCLPVDF